MDIVVLVLLTLAAYAVGYIQGRVKAENLWRKRYRICADSFYELANLAHEATDLAERAINHARRRSG